MGGLFPCYAFDLANTRLKQRYLANTNLVEPRISYRVVGGDIEYSPYKDPFYPRWWPERLDKIRAIKKPTGIFLDDMSDWMGDYWPEEQTRHELQVMRDCPQHRFYTLTKQPQNLPHWEFPENCWVGVTATDAVLFDKAISYLQDIEATIKYISFEPLLKRCDVKDTGRGNPLKGIDWLIIGACTGPYSEMLDLHHRLNGHTPAIELKPLGNRYSLQPRIEWVREIVEAADKAGVKVFLKNNLRPIIPCSPRYMKQKGEDDIELRQELPK